MTSGRHVGANLVSAPRAQTDSKQRESAEMPDRLPIRQSRATAFQPGRHARAVLRIARDRLADAARALEPAFHQRQINLLDFAAGKLVRKIPVRLVCFRHEKHAGGEAVETMDNTGPEIAANARKSMKPVQERIYDRSSVQARARVNRKARRFIYGDGRGVLIQYQQRNVFRLRPQRRKGAGFERNRLGSAY